LKERRSLYEFIFGKPKQQQQNNTMVRMLNSGPSFYDFSGSGYDSDTVRATSDAFARNAAKLKPKHIRRVNGDIKSIPSHVEWLLQVRPNKLMDAYTFYYRIATQYLMTNNVFVWIKRDERNQVVGLYPLTSSSVTLIQDRDNPGGDLIVEFRFYDGQTYRAPYLDVIHIRRFFFKNDFYGESNQSALTPILNLISITNQGIANAVKSSAFVRGLLSFVNMLKNEDMKKYADQFQSDYLSANNNGGVAAIDSKVTYTELKSDPKMIDDKQMTAMADKVYSYFGSNKHIVQSDFSEEQWSAFYESMIEPFALQLGLEMTYKIFSEGAQGHGNEIVFEANRLQYASNATKIKVIETLVDRGLMNKNQGREIFNMGPIEGGEEYIVSLNYVQADKANEYQLGKSTEPKPTPKGGDEENGEGSKA
jgi:HK97 family phage portal protein